MKTFTEILDWNNVLLVTQFIYFSALMSWNCLALHTCLSYIIKGIVLGVKLGVRNETKKSLECGRMHIWALRTQKFPETLRWPWTPGHIYTCFTHTTSLLWCRHFTLEIILDLRLFPSWIRYWVTLLEIT